MDSPDRSPAIVNWPFLIYALPRSRTAWLAAFLSYREWTCHHEKAIEMRSIGDVVRLLRAPWTGAAETAAGPAWAILRHHVPLLKSVVIRRPVDEIVDSFMHMTIPGFRYDRALLEKGMARGVRSLERISEQPGTLTVDYADLEQEDSCRRIFEFCLPYRFDRDWWLSLKDRNIQADVGAVLRYYQANKEAVEHFKRICKTEMWSLRRHANA